MFGIGCWQALFCCPVDSIPSCLGAEFLHVLDNLVRRGEAQADVAPWKLRSRQNGTSTLKELEEVPYNTRTGTRREGFLLKSVR